MLTRSISFFLGALLFGTLNYVGAWTSPGSAPPNGNVSAPLNVGVVDQIKSAGLGVNSLAVYGNAILNGASRYLNFGTTAGDSGYGIRDNAGVLEFKDTGDTWKNFTAIIQNFFSSGSSSITQITFGDGTVQTMALPSCTTDGATLSWNAAAQAWQCSEFYPTVLLAHFDSPVGTITSMTESSFSAHTMTGSSARVSTTQSKFGGASAYFDGGNDYITVPSHSDWDLGTGSFTVDFWIYITNGYPANSDTRYVINGINGFQVALGTSAGGVTWIGMYVEGENHYLGSRPAANGWHHIAFVRSGTTLYGFIDGVSQSWGFGSNSLSTSDVQSDGLEIGRGGSDSADFQGYIDELRITKGQARWTSNFTPPTASYSPQQ